MVHLPKGGQWNENLGIPWPPLLIPNVTRRPKIAAHYHSLTYSSFLGWGCQNQSVWQWASRRPRDQGEELGLGALAWAGQHMFCRLVNSGRGSKATNGVVSESERIYTWFTSSLLDISSVTYSWKCPGIMSSLIDHMKWATRRHPTWAGLCFNLKQIKKEYLFTKTLSETTVLDNMQCIMTTAECTVYYGAPPWSPLCFSNPCWRIWWANAWPLASC